MRNFFCAISAAFFLITLTSCSSAPSGRAALATPAKERISKPTEKFMVREFLFPNTMESRGYGYYSYLVIRPITSDSYPLALAAATAYMCDFETTEETLPIGKLNDKRILSVFYAPVRAASPSLIESKSGQLLVDLYNHNYAEYIAGIVKSIKFNDPDFNPDFNIAIFSSPTPILNNSYYTSNNVSPDSIFFYDLSNLPVSLVKNKIQAFRKLMTGDYKIKVSGTENKKFEFILDPITAAETLNAGMTDRVRKVFESLGSLVSMFIPTAYARSHVYKCN